MTSLDRKMDQLAVGFLSVFGLPPVEFVDLAADLGCRYVSTVVQGVPLVPLGYPPFSLKDDAGLRRDMLAAMDHRGVTSRSATGSWCCPAPRCTGSAADLDALAELGVPRINVVSLDPDLGRTFDQFAALTELAAQRGIQTVVEPVPGLTVGDLPTALAAREHVGRPDFRILIDTMHLVRSGSTAADLAAVDPDCIGYAQLNDTTLRPRMDNYMEEAMFERMVPGEGELPLRDILAALPPDVVIEIEVPRRSLALAGVSPIDRLRPCVTAARRLLSDSSARVAQRQAGGAVDRVDDGHVLDRVLRRRLDRFAAKHGRGERVELIRVGGSVRETLHAPAVGGTNRQPVQEVWQHRIENTHLAVLADHASADPQQLRRPHRAADPAGVPARRRRLRPPWRGRSAGRAISPAPRALRESNHRRSGPCGPHSTRRPWWRPRRANSCSGCRRTSATGSTSRPPPACSLPSSPEAMISSTRRLSGW